ncbi:MAG: helix-turn-helix domain-containing protein [Gemmatimonas sp.]
MYERNRRLRTKSHISGALDMSEEDRNAQSGGQSSPAVGAGSALQEGVGSSAVETAKEMPFAEARAQALAEFDRTYLTAALARHSGNIARTARSLGLHRQSLQKLMARRGIKSGRAVPTAE